MEKFIMAAGTAVRVSEITYNSDGKPVIVLLHGYLESLDVWDDFSELLKGHARIVAIDLPGHGISEVIGPVHTMEFLADTVKGALDELGVDKCVLVGHSMGGYAALEFLRKYPASLTGLVLFHSTPDPDTEEKKEHRRREIEIVESGKKDLLATTVEKGFAHINRKRFADVIEDLREQVILTDEDGIVALLRGMSERLDSNGTMQKSAVPQLMIFGRLDEYITQETALEIIGNQQQAQSVWLENSGHMGFVEEAVRSAEILLSFAESCGA